MGNRSGHTPPSDTTQDRSCSNNEHCHHACSIIITYQADGNALRSLYSTKRERVGASQELSSYLSPTNVEQSCQKGVFFGIWGKKQTNLSLFYLSSLAVIKMITCRFTNKEATENMFPKFERVFDWVSHDGLVYMIYAEYHENTCRLIRYYLKDKTYGNRIGVDWKPE